MPYTDEAYFGKVPVEVEESDEVIVFDGNKPKVFRKIKGTNLLLDTFRLRINSQENKNKYTYREENKT